MLFELKGTKVRLFGSMHNVPKGKKDWIASTRQIYDWADEIYIEMKRENAKLFSRIPAKLSATQLPADLKNKIRQIWSKHHPPLESCSAVFVLFVVQNFGIEFSEGVEPHIEQWSKDLKTLHELETPLEFIAAFDNVSIDVLSNDIASRIGKTPQARKLTEQIYRLWRKADRVEMEKTLSGVVPREIWNAMFLSRNRAWAEKISKISNSDANTLVVCGAGHFCGPGSVLDELNTKYGLSYTEI